jgi:hypothetical protein
MCSSDANFADSVANKKERKGENVLLGRGVSMGHNNEVEASGGTVFFFGAVTSCTFRNSTAVSTFSQNSMNDGDDCIEIASGSTKQNQHNNTHEEKTCRHEKMFQFTNTCSHPGTLSHLQILCLVLRGQHH